MSTESRPPRPASATASDSDLSSALVAVGKGDAAAFDLLYQATRRALWARADAVLHDPDLSEEVAQEVLAQVWVQASRFDPSQGAAMAWLSAITHRRAVDRVRSVQAERRRDREHQFSNERLLAEVDVDEVVAVRLATEEVRRQLGVLPAVQREAVVLSFFAGRTHVQISEQLGVPLGTVKSRIRDGLLRLAAAVDGMSGGAPSLSPPAAPGSTGR
ncbi:RNA polymerase sigma-70 factor (ECF subfamily) [Motilibacter peucedani]|uniref:RNA polymerase sigma factor n=1 Tax=Motilibacter peucedani TaxID=598650 RepID=A0A420XLE9_9ACTN|nr:sigma-70 family RNA polymerase sigma factor [Motilibacter peucedani]RKS71312.1 RNA polymerase sigma-70 factor (ECF subfamily) [Motilibacter peucedani]